MRFIPTVSISLALVFVFSTFAARAQQDAARAVAGGGISVPGWQGKIDPQEEKAGMALNNAKLAPRR
jgi:hypothetical protein